MSSSSFHSIKSEILIYTIEFLTCTVRLNCLLLCVFAWYYTRHNRTPLILPIRILPIPSTPPDPGNNLLGV